MFSLASYLAAPPSPDMSREITLARVDYGDNENTEFHVTAIELADESILVAAVDGIQLRLLKTDIAGNLLAESIVKIDLNAIITFDGYQQDSGKLTLVTLSGTESRLIKVIEVNLADSSYTEQILATDVKKFRLLYDQVIIEHQDGLYLYSINQGTAAQKLVSGAIHSWATRKADDTIYVMANRSIDGMIEGVLTTYNISGSNYKNTLTRIVAAAARDDYTRDLRDIFVSNNVMTALYVWTDKRDGVNYLTLHQHLLTAEGIEQTSRFQGRFPIYKGRFDIIEAETGSAKVLMQTNTVNGINLVRSTLATEHRPIVEALTKTRKFSKLSDYSVINGETVLIFCDFERAERVINLASSQDEAIKATSRISTIEPMQVVVISLLVLAMALFMGGIGYLLLTSFLPAAGLLALQKMTPEYRHKLPVQIILAVFAQTFIKILLTRYIVNQTAYFEFRPLLIGSEPYIYLAMIFMSGISCLLMVLYHKKSQNTGAATSAAFIRFVVADYVQYTLLIFMYICTSLIIGKI